MEILLALLVNIIYGVLFFLAFAVMFLTVALFAMAFWDKVVRPLLNRLRRGNQA
ncbi:MAG: hypothetical protein M3220_02250 [Chloroflexota bacterium]|nr:hypothetical protein [Chloroflexota bacterium]